jgi:hypothetical protein
MSSVTVLAGTGKGASITTADFAREAAFFLEGMRIGFDSMLIYADAGTDEPRDESQNCFSKVFMVFVVYDTTY